MKAGEEINDKVLSQREIKRVGATATYIVQKISESLDDGKELRDDGFFNEDETGRSNADEILEGVLLKSQREHEEKN